MSYPQAPSQWQPQPQSRPLTAPSVGIVVAITLFFGLFGLIPANSRANEARQLGYPTRPYWAAFWWTIGATTTVWTLVWVLIIGFGASAAEKQQACIVGHPNDWPTACAQQ